MTIVLCLSCSQLQFPFVQVCMAIQPFPFFLMTLCVLVMSQTSSSVLIVDLECTTVTRQKQLESFVEVRQLNDDM